MILIEPKYEILSIHPDSLHLIEFAGRTCYKSEHWITDESSKEFASMIMKMGHLSVIEHASMSVRFTCDRGVSHELVRHRLASFSQESTRYCNYKGGVTFIIPPWVGIDKGNYEFSFTEPTQNEASWLWYNSMLEAEQAYKDLLSLKWTPQQARSVLPNSLKTEIIMSANLREWLHVFKLRTAKAAHPQMRELMIPLLEEVKILIPIIFDGITY